MPVKSIKSKAIDLIKMQSDSTTWEALTYQMYVQAKVARGLADLEAGRVKSHEQFMTEIDEWLESLGPKKRKSTSKTKSHS